MASPSPSRSPFREQQLCNSTSSASSIASNKPSNKNEIFPATVTNLQVKTSIETNDENVLRTSCSYSPNKRTQEKTAGAMAFHNSGKSRSMDSSMVDALRKHTANLIDLTAPLNTPIVEKRGPTNAVDISEEGRLEPSPIPSPSSLIPTSTKEGFHAFVETVTSEQSEDEDDEEIFEDQEEIQLIPQAIVNPFDDSSDPKDTSHDISLQSIVSIFTEVPACKDDKAKSPVVNDDDQIISKASSNDSIDPSSMPPESRRSSTCTLYHSCNEFSLKSNSSEDGKLSARSSTDEKVSITSSTSLGSTEGKLSTTSSGTDGNDDVVQTSSTISETEKPKEESSMAFATPTKQRSLEDYDDDGIMMSMSPKDRYLFAVKQAASWGRKQPSPSLSPKDRYLLAVKQTAEKCKKMNSAPKEITTGPNLTPTSVKAQIKRVEGQCVQGTGSFDRFTSLDRHSIQFVSSSPLVPTPNWLEKNSSEEDSEFGTPLFETVELGATVETKNQTKIHPKGAPSAFHSFHRDSSDDDDALPVREHIDVSTGDSPDKKYLQLDLDAASPSMSNSSLGLDFKSHDSRTTLRPVESVRSSIYTIFRNNNLSAKLSPAKQYMSVASPKPGEEDVADEIIAPIEPSSRGLHQAKSGGAIDSLRSSIAMIWSSSKTKPSSSENKVSAVMKTKSADLGDVENQPDSKRERPVSQNSSVSSYKQSPKRKNQRTEELLGMEILQPRPFDMPMGSQYLAAHARGRSPVFEKRTITPVPSGDGDSQIPGLLGDRKGSYDSLDDEIPAYIRNTANLYNIPSRQASVSQSPSKRLETKSTEDSFIDATLKAKNVDDMVVVYSGTPDTRDWHPPEQERKEHDTMVRAILNRPHLIDKSIREPEQQPSHRNWPKIRRNICIGVLMLLFSATVAVCLACGITGQCLLNESNVQPEEEPEFKPLVLDLPEYTRESLSSFHTAQTKAYVWLENDPNRATYSESRMLQRFALATLYYSTKIAQNWTVSTAWLSYDIDECYWFSNYEGMDICNSEGELLHLVLTKNNLRGNIPPELSLITSLLEIDLSRNVLIGPIPSQLGGLTNLRSLWLEKNELNGVIPSQLSNLKSLTSLALSTNQLIGAIPPGLTSLTNLTSLRLFYNSLTGSLPTEIGLLSNLELLDVDVNKLTGIIPSELGLLENLRELWLDWNHFVGPIPTEIGNLKNLLKLYMGRTFEESKMRADGWRESGDYRIPSEIGRLVSLEELYLDNNDLTGIIPTELSALTNLQRATLDNNMLTDTISPVICSLFGGELEVLSVDCDEVLCSCGCTCA